jgi:hypothetical protein
MLPEQLFCFRRFFSQFSRCFSKIQGHCFFDPPPAAVAPRTMNNIRPAHPALPREIRR